MIGASSPFSSKRALTPLPLLGQFRDWCPGLPQSKHIL